MKYSILLPYCKRPELRSSLLSFCYHYVGREDYEVVIVEDFKNFCNSDDHCELLNIVHEFDTRVPIRCVVDNQDSFSPCRKYNVGFMESVGNFVVLSSPEIFHESNILDGLDRLFKESPESYFVCACRAREFKNPVVEYKDHFSGEMVEWYQHSQIRNKLFHFCSALSRTNYLQAGGFDEAYCSGIGFDDESFLYRVKIRGISVVAVDSLVTTHIEHDRSYHRENRPLIEVNRKLFLKQLASDDFTGNFVGAK